MRLCIPFLTRQHARFLAALCASVVLLASCSQYVQSIPAPVDLIADTDLNQESQLPLLYTGLGGAFGQTLRLSVPYASILSDEFGVANGISRDPAKAEIFNLDDGNPRRSFMNSPWGAFAATRFQATNLLKKETLIRFTQDSNRKKLLYLGNFFRATVEHYLAALFGITARRGGAVIDGGAFIPSSAMHDTALAKYALALQNAQTPYERRLVNSFVARVQLLEGRYSAALTAATDGLQQGDAPFQVTYPATAYNQWTDFADIEKDNTVLPHPRFRAYIVAEPGEAGRIPLALGTRPAAGRTEPYYIQVKYNPTSPIDVMTWQENALMLAELRLRVANDMSAALLEVNRVRSAVPPVQGAPRLALRTTTNLDSVFIERDKQFFGTGLRLFDQRRLNRWHFQGASAATAWYFLPIAQNEFDSNPNLQVP
jgi:starch-binding outer membrane protein, SusD/RagB family